MKESILKGDLQNTAKILGRSWEAKKKIANSITNKKVDQVYEVAINAGAYSGKISGAGGGGFIVFMVDPVKRVNVLKALQELEGRAMNFHFIKHGTQSWIA
jgi:D-glycero-alpha-D-manno-heptose-7-phosphate kinase